jgi:hypothetical protein
MKLGFISVDSAIIIQPLITYIFHLLNTGDKMEYSGATQKLFIDLKETYDSDILYIILIKFDIHVKLVRLIKVKLA